MSHFAINYTFNKPQTGNSPEFKRLEEIIDKLESHGGSLKCYKGNPDGAAARISRSKIIEHVVVVHIAETSIGVWRKGKKS